MIIRERAIDAGAVSGAAALIVGAWWMAGQINETGAPVAAPHPTVTVTAPATTSAVSAPPSSANTGQTRVEAVAAPGGTSGGDRPGAVAPSGPSPTPRPPASGSSAGGLRAAVRLSHPLGVLPDAQLDLTLGGSR